MKALLIVLAVAAVLAVFKLGFMLLDSSRKRRARSVTDVSQLKGKKLHAIEVLPDAEDALQRIETALLADGADVVHRSDDQLVAHVGRSGGSLAFSGIVGVPPSALPVRISAVRRDGKLEARIDEDFGFQIFMGPAKQAFVSGYRKALAYHGERLRAALA